MNSFRRAFNKIDGDSDILKAVGNYFKNINKEITTAPVVGQMLARESLMGRKRRKRRRLRDRPKKRILGIGDMEEFEAMRMFRDMFSAIQEGA